MILNQRSVTKSPINTDLQQEGASKTTLKNKEGNYLSREYNLEGINDYEV